MRLELSREDVLHRVNAVPEGPAPSVSLWDQLRSQGKFDDINRFENSPEPETYVPPRRNPFPRINAVRNPPSKDQYLQQSTTSIYPSPSPDPLSPRAIVPAIDQQGHNIDLPAVSMTSVTLSDPQSGSQLPSPTLSPDGVSDAEDQDSKLYESQESKQPDDTDMPTVSHDAPTETESHVSEALVDEQIPRQADPQRTEIGWPSPEAPSQQADAATAFSSTEDTEPQQEDIVAESSETHDTDVLMQEVEADETNSLGPDVDPNEVEEPESDEEAPPTDDMEEEDRETESLPPARRRSAKKAIRARAPRRSSSRRNVAGWSAVGEKRPRSTPTKPSQKLSKGARRLRSHTASSQQSDEDDADEDAGDEAEEEAGEEAEEEGGKEEEQHFSLRQSIHDIDQIDEEVVDSQVTISNLRLSDSTTSPALRDGATGRSDSLQAQQDDGEQSTSAATISDDATIVDVVDSTLVVFESGAEQDAGAVPDVDMDLEIVPDINNEQEAPVVSTATAELRPSVDAADAVVTSETDGTAVVPGVVAGTQESQVSPTVARGTPVTTPVRVHESQPLTLSADHSWTYPPPTPTTVSSSFTDNIFSPPVIKEPASRTILSLVPPPLASPSKSGRSSLALDQIQRCVQSHTWPEGLGDSVTDSLKNAMVNAWNAGEARPQVDSETVLKALLGEFFSCDSLTRFTQVLQESPEGVLDWPKALPAPSMPSIGDASRPGWHYDLQQIADKNKHVTVLSDSEERPAYTRWCMAVLYATTLCKLDELAGYLDDHEERDKHRALLIGLCPDLRNTLSTARASVLASYWIGLILTCSRFSLVLQAQTSEQPAMVQISREDFERGRKHIEEFKSRFSIFREARDLFGDQLGPQCYALLDLKRLLIGNRHMRKGDTYPITKFVKDFRKVCRIIADHAVLREGLQRMVRLGQSLNGSE